MELDDAYAMVQLGYYYAEGLRGFPQDYTKALELWHRAGELGNTDAYYNIGSTYYIGVERDMKKGKKYC